MAGLYDDESNITAYLDAGNGFMILNDDMISVTDVDREALESYKEDGSDEWAMTIPVDDVESVRITAGEVEFGLKAGGVVTARAYFI